MTLQDGTTEKFHLLGSTYEKGIEIGVRDRAIVRGIVDGLPNDETNEKKAADRFTDVRGFFYDATADPSLPVSRVIATSWGKTRAHVIGVYRTPNQGSFPSPPNAFPQTKSPASVNMRVYRVPTRGSGSTRYFDRGSTPPPAESDEEVNDTGLPWGDIAGIHNDDLGLQNKYFTTMKPKELQYPRKAVRVVVTTQLSFDPYAAPHNIAQYQDTVNQSSVIFAGAGGPWLGVPDVTGILYPESTLFHGAYVQAVASGVQQVFYNVRYVFTIINGKWWEQHVMGFDPIGEGWIVRNKPMYERRDFRGVFPLGTPPGFPGIPPGVG